VGIADGIDVGVSVGLVVGADVGEIVLGRAVGDALGVKLGELVAVDIVTLRIRLLSISAMYTLPDESTFTPVG
jgi:hypothetical protein